MHQQYAGSVVSAVQAISSVRLYLDVLPIALNTRIKYIKMSFNKIRIVDASFQVEKKLSFEVRINFVSFQFYEHLIEIDLSSNIIEDIEDKREGFKKISNIVIEG